MFALALVILLSMSRVADAQTALCRDLRAELSALETGRGRAVSQRFQQYDRAVSQQQLQIQKTERAAQRNGCNLRRSSVCTRINSSLSAMYSNLESLRVQRDRLAPSSASPQQRARLIRSMQVNGCLDDAPGVASNRPQQEEPRRRTLLEQIFGTKTYSDQGASGEFDPNLNNRYGTFRTLCVRTCDGYYFPISFSTTSDRFETDLAQCQRMCPGSTTELFYHPMPGGDAEQAISYRTGESYGDLPNAFAYRKSVETSCSCRSSGLRLETLAGDEPQREQETDTEGTVAERPIPRPTFRVDRDVDLDGLALANGGLSAERLIELASGEEAGKPVSAGSSRIRIVGPEFFPVQ